MITWLTYPLLFVAGALATLVVARDAPNFGLVRAVVALALVPLFIMVLGFWTDRQWSRDRDDMTG